MASATSLRREVRFLLLLPLAHHRGRGTWHVAADQRGFAAGLIETTRQLGHSLGISLASAILATSLLTASSPQLGYQLGFTAATTIMAALAALGVVVVMCSSGHGPSLRILGARGVGPEAVVAQRDARRLRLG